MSGTIRIPVDVTNPGQFFACCGLLELADRLWAGTTAAFDLTGFVIKPSEPNATLTILLETFRCSKPAASDDADSRGTDDDEVEEEDDEKGEDTLASPISIGTPINLRLDWWADKALKPWAGSMNAQLIFRAMLKAIDSESADPFNDCRVINDPSEAHASAKKLRRPKKREPFYFDSRRGGNAQSLDVGFAPDAISMTSAACPAVEALCMIGLQRFRPMPTDRPRVFVYRAWAVPLPPSAAAAAACGLLPGVGGDHYQFENAFRTDQRKHKGFLPATRITEGDTP
ncbi:MAG: type I-U CRISPR-associated protein Cas8c [Phycisphaerales bacterium]